MSGWLLILIKLVWELICLAKLLRRSTNTISKCIRQHLVVRLEVEVLVIAGVEPLWVYILLVFVDDLCCLLWNFLLRIDLAKSRSDDVVNLD